MGICRKYITILSAFLFCHFLYAAAEKVPTGDLVRGCQKWVSLNKANREKLKEVAYKKCYDIAHQGSYLKNAHAVCENLSLGTKYLDAHQVYSYEKCLEGIKAKRFPKDSLDVLRKYQEDLSLYSIMQAFEKADGLSEVPKKREFIPRMEVAEACVQWSKRNQGTKQELGNIAAEKCIITAVSGRFHKDSFDICKSLPDGIKTSESHEVYAFEQCLSRIKNKVASKRQLEHSIRRCNQLFDVSPETQIDLFEDLLKHLK
jgi:hypothetical protein